MAEDTKQPNIPPASEPDPSKSADVSTGQQVTGASQADAEKDSKVEEAKARVAAAKESISEKAAAAQPPGAPKAPVKKKEEGPKPTDASSHRLVKRLKGKIKGALIERTEVFGQPSKRNERFRI